MTHATETSPDDVFTAAFAQLDKIKGFMTSKAAASMEHSEIEGYVQREGLELLRLVMQGHFDWRAEGEERLDEVIDADGVAHRNVEADHDRDLASVVGRIEVCRLAYRHQGAKNLYPADATANLPGQLYSHGLQELAAIESSRGSFEEATEAIRRSSGVAIPKRQVEDLARVAAVDFEAFYDSVERPEAEKSEVVVISADGKGIAMRPEALRPATAAKAASEEHKLDGRLSKGEKRNRKRIAELGAVYTVSPEPRSPGDVMARSHDEGPPKPAPVAKHKWLTASVVDDAKEVIASVFDEAERRDPRHEHDWVALVDGNNHQISRIKAEAKARGIDKLTIVVDWVHVLEYIWGSAWSFFSEGGPTAEEWVGEKVLAVLEGKAVVVAASIRRKATTLGLDDTQRKSADVCADYLLAKAPYLDYPTALAKGWPIGTGVIEKTPTYCQKDQQLF